MDHKEIQIFTFVNTLSCSDVLNVVVVGNVIKLQLTKVMGFQGNKQVWLA